MTGLGPARLPGGEASHSLDSLLARHLVGVRASASNCLRMNTDCQRKSRLSLGVAVVLLLFLSETVVAHQHMPSVASPYVWALLGGGSLVCLGLAAWFHGKSRSC